MNNDYDHQNEQQNQQNQQEQQKQQYGYQYGAQGYPPHGQGPYGQGPYGQGPYNQNPYGQNPYGYYGQNPYGYPPIYQQPVSDSNAKNCHMMGLLSIVCLFVMQILSIVFGALALNYAKKSKMEMGYECADAKNGRLMGMIGLIIGSILTGLVVLAYLILFISLLLI